MRVRVAGALAALIIGLLSVSAHPARAQTTGEMDGTVLDQNGIPLPGIAVEIRSPALLGTRTTVTDTQGRYRFPALPPGVYTATATMSGNRKTEQKNIRVSLSATATVPLTISLTIKEEVVVSGEAPVIDVTKNAIGTSTTIDTLQRLPLGRNFVSIANTVAGTGNDLSGITVYGATGLENQYLIDGVNTTGVKIGDQGKLLNNEFVQEVEVRTGGYEAEYSRALGGVINVVTKSGGNEFHGDVFGYYDSASLAAKDARVGDEALVSLGERLLPRRVDAGADVGGYFVKDRLWFFGAYDRVNLDQDIQVGVSRQFLPITETPNVITTFAGRTDGTRTNLFAGKLTFRLGESNTIGLSAFGDPGKFTGVTSDVVGPDSARNGTTETGGTDLSAKWDGLFGTRFLAQFQYGYHEDKSETTPENSGLAINDRQRSLRTYLPGSGQAYWTSEKYRRNAFKVSGSGFFGSHEVKGGVDYESLNSTFYESYGGSDFITNFLTSGSGAFNYASNRYFASLPLNCTAHLDADGNLVKGNFGTPGASNPVVPSVQDCFGYSQASSVQNPPSTKNIGFFAQDSWKVLKNLTVNAGIRYDEQSLKNAAGETLIKLTNEWSPRAGVVWDFLNNGRSKLTASYGRYYEIIPQDIQTRALGNEYTVFAYNYTQGARDPTTDPSGFAYSYIQGGELTSSSLKGMYQDEIIVGAEYEFLRNWSIGVKGIYKAMGRVVEDRCDLADTRVDLASFITPGALTTCALINPGEGGSTLSNIRDPANPQCVAADGSITGPCESIHPRRYYRAVELDLAHRFAKNFYVLANYVYAKLEGNYDGNQKQSNGQQDPNINADFDYVDLVPNNFGRLALDRKHQFKASGTYVFPFGLNVGGVFRFASGAPFSITGFARNGYTTERYLLPNRGVIGDLPSTYEMDVHFEYAVHLGTVTVSPILDVFNLLNRQGVTGRDGIFNLRSAAANDPTNTSAAVESVRNDAAACRANPNLLNYACSTNANYLHDNDWQRPRQFRVGARISF